MGNMKPKWIIEDFEPDNRFGDLANEIKRQGMDCEVITYTPFQNGSYDVFNTPDCVIVQSSINLALQLQRQKSWVPGSWLIPERFECTTYYAHLGKYLFNDRYVMMPRAEVARKKEWLYNLCFGDYEELFMRPNSGLKPFTAGLFNKTRWESDWTWVEEYSTPESIVVISTPKSIKGEWRFVCTENQVLTGCQYRINGEHNLAPGYPEGAAALAKEISGVYQPAPIFVVDICKDADDNYYLMEVGSLSVAGLYACEMEPIVRVASEIAVKEWEDIYKV
jgi:hypothetical protein